MTPAWDVHPGTGPYLLLVHGFLSSRAQWSPNLEALGAVCQPVVMELYGHGRSPSPEDGESYTPVSYLTAMEEIRAALGAESWFVCGYSLGGALTIRYALTYQNRVRGHIFTNSMSAFADPVLMRHWAKNSQASSDRIRHNGLAAIEQIAVHPKRARRLPKDIYDALVRDAQLLDPAGIANTLQFTTPQATVRLDIGANRVPALLACGHFEARFRPHREYAEANMPHLKVVEIDTGHAVNMQAADQFNRAVVDFISSHRDA